MPPNSPKIPDAEIELIRKWIEGGALENSGSVVTAKAKPKFEFKLDPAALGKPAGTPAMPENLTTEPFVPQAKPNAVVAMASSPWAPLVAVAGHKQVLLYRTTDRHLVGVLPFPEGAIYVLKFSRNGDLLLAGGGRDGQSGIAVAWDVKKGTRVFEVGKEYDVVLAADISPDHSQVVLGGPGKVVRIYNTADGSLAQELRKHTEWITAAEFSPDGVLARDRRPQQRTDRLGSEDGPRVLRPARPPGGDHRRQLAARLERRRVVERRWHRQALGDGERRQHQVVRRPRRRDGLGPVRQGWAAAHDRPRSRGPALGPEWRQAARVRAVRRPGARGRLHATTSRRSSPPTGPARSASGTSRTGAGWPTWRSIRRRLPLASSRRSSTLAAVQAEADSLAKQLAPFQNAIAPANAALTQAQAKARPRPSRPPPSRPPWSSSSSRRSRPSKPRPMRRGPSCRPPTNSPVNRRWRRRPPRRRSLRPLPAEKSAAEALAAAKAATEKALADKTAHDPALAAATAALKAAATPEALAVAAAELTKQVQKSVELTQAIAAAGTRQSAASQALAQATAAKNAAPAAAASARSTAKAATLAVHSARDAFNHADQDRAATDKALADARTALQAATTALTAVKQEHAQASAAKAGAEKALAEKKAPLDAALAKVQALKAEIDALAVEKKRSDGSKGGGLASAARPGK